MDFPVVVPASDFHKIEIKERETIQWKKKGNKVQFIYYLLISKGDSHSCYLWQLSHSIQTVEHYM